MTALDPVTAEQLVGRFWMAYDEGEFEVMAALLAEDVRFSCRTDTGDTEFEDFVRADRRGRDETMQWQMEHRLASPYPLRHLIANFHLIDCVGDLHGYRHYLTVATVKDLKPEFLPGGVMTGSIRAEDGELHIVDISLTLDTMDSVLFRDLDRRSVSRPTTRSFQ